MIAVPAARFATGHALNITARQLGASRGIALVVTILGTDAFGSAAAVPLESFRDGCLMVATSGAAVCLVALFPRPPRLVAAPAGGEP